MGLPTQIQKLQTLIIFEKTSNLTYDKLPKIINLESLCYFQQKQNKNEILKKSDPRIVGQKIKNLSSNKTIPNLHFISKNDKGEISKKRLNKFTLLLPIDHRQAKKDFLTLARYGCKHVQKQLKDKQGGKRIQINDQKYSSSFQNFEENYPEELVLEKCLREYTKQSFFHKILNIGLKVLINPMQYCYLRGPFSHVFHSIKKLYQNQVHEFIAEKQFYCYRGCLLSQQELKDIEKNIDGFIEMEGFISTSLKEDTALNFGDIILEILVKSENLGGQFDNGFADISELSQNANEKEILFNSLNIFKILSVERQKIISEDFKITWIKLQYGGLKKIEGKDKEQLTQEELQVYEYYQIQKIEQQNCFSFAQTLNSLFYYTEAQQCFQKMHQEIQKRKTKMKTKKMNIEEKQEQLMIIKYLVRLYLHFSEEEKVEKILQENLPENISRQIFESQHKKFQLQFIASILEQVGDFYKSSYENEKAKRYYERIIEIKKLLRLPYGKIIQKINKKIDYAQVLREQKKIQSELVKYKGRFNVSYLNCLEKTIHAHIQLKNWDQARQSGENSLKIIEKVDSQSCTGIKKKILYYLMHVYYQRNNKQAFVKHLQAYILLPSDVRQIQQEEKRLMNIIQFCYQFEFYELELEILQRLFWMLPEQFQFPLQHIDKLINNGIFIFIHEQEDIQHLSFKYFSFVKNLIKKSKSDYSNFQSIVVETILLSFTSNQNEYQKIQICLKKFQQQLKKDQKKCQLLKFVRIILEKVQEKIIECIENNQRHFFVRKMMKNFISLGNGLISFINQSDHLIAYLHSIFKIHIYLLNSKNQKMKKLSQKTESFIAQSIILVYQNFYKNLSETDQFRINILFIMTYMILKRKNYLEHYRIYFHQIFKSAEKYWKNNNKNKPLKHHRIQIIDSLCKIIEENQFEGGKYVHDCEMILGKIQQVITEQKMNIRSGQEFVLNQFSFFIFAYDKIHELKKFVDCKISFLDELCQNEAKQRIKRKMQNIF